MAHTRKYETRQEFDDAFEELYKRSPVPQIVKPLLAVYRSPVPRVMQGQGSGVKAIFDTMKRNVSMSSDLNTSCTTADTTFSSDNQQGEGQTKDKENLTPEKGSERRSAVEQQHSSFAVPWSSAARVGANVARQAALVDDDPSGSPIARVTRSIAASLPQKFQTSATDDGCSASSAWAVADKSNMDRNGDKGDRIGNARKDVVADFLISSSRVTRSHRDTDSAFTSSAFQPESGWCTKDGAVPGISHCRGESPVQHVDGGRVSVINQRNAAIWPVQVVSGHTSTSYACREGSQIADKQGDHRVSEKVSESGTFSPLHQMRQTPVICVLSPEDKSADQETLQLVSKLVQRLQSSNGNDSDSASESFDENNTEKDIAKDRVDRALSGQHQSSKAREARVDQDICSGTENAVRKSKGQNSKSRLKNSGSTILEGQQKENPDTASDQRQVNHNVPSKSSQSLSKLKLHKSVNNNSKKKSVARDRKTDLVETDQAVDEEEPYTEGENNDPVLSSRQKSVAQNKDMKLQQKPNVIIDRIDLKHKAASSTAKRKRMNVIYDSESDEQLVKTRSLRRKESYPKTRAQTSSDVQHVAEPVEVDVIAQKSSCPVAPDTDVFSLDLSHEDNSTDVETDAILFASQKTGPLTAASRHVGKASPQKSHPTKLRDDVLLADKKEKKGQSKTVQLRSWSLQPVPKLHSVRVEGKLPNTDYYWCSSVIVKRVTSRRLLSNNGSYYILIGNISCVNTQHAGFSRELALKFKHGFPLDWKELIQTELETAESVSPAKEKAKQGSPAVSQAQRMKNTKAQSKQKVVNTPSQRKRKSHEVCHTPETHQKDADNNSSIWTPQGVVSRALEASQVHRTSSGRCVIPPLAHWAGQYVERDAHGSVVIGFRSQAAEQHFAKMAEEEMILSANNKRLKPSVCSFNTTSSSTSKMNSKVQNTSRSKHNHTHHTKLNVREDKSGSKDKSAGKSRSVHTDMNNSAESTSTLAAGEMGAAVNSGNSLDDLMEVSVDNMEQEVMAIVKRSKETRRQNAGKKRKTCYSIDTESSPAITERSFDLPSRCQDSTQKLQVAGQQFSESVLSTSGDIGMSGGVSGNSRSRITETADRGSKNIVLTEQRKGRSARHARTGNDHSECVLKRKSLQTGKDLSTDAENDTVNDSPSVLEQSGQSSATEKADLSASTSVNSGTVKYTRVSRTKSGRHNGKASRETVILDSTEDESEDMHDTYGTVDSSLTEFETENKGKRKRGRPPKKGRTGGKGARKAAVSGVDQEDDIRPWSTEEIERLQRAKEQVRHDHAQFWEEVSRLVGTRSADECASCTLGDIPNPKNKNKKKQNAKETGEAHTVQACRGTLKRRRELRSYMEHENDSLQDDLFSATPFRSSTRSKLPSMDFNNADEKAFGRNPNFFTPSVDGSRKTGQHFSKTPVSNKKTPGIAGTFSPWMETGSTQRKAVDQYIFRRKNRRQLTKSFPVKGNRTAQPETPPAVRLFARTNSTGSLFKITEEQSSEDSEEGSKDNYYSDEEN